MEKLQQLKMDRLQMKISFIIVFLFGSILTFIVFFGIKKSEKHREEVRINGEKVVAIFSHYSGKLSSRACNFSYLVNSEEFYCSIIKPIFLPKDYPLTEIPFLVKYDKNDPDFNVEIIEETFLYKGYEIKWYTKEIETRYFMQINKIN